MSLAIASLRAGAGEGVTARFLGAQSCASSMCHGGADQKHDQVLIWSKKDFHTRAPATLAMARSARIAETLKIADATADNRCTVCHNPFQTVSAERKGPLVGKNEGVSCESCHNAGEPWLLTHTREDLNHDQKVAAGLRDLKNLYVRANTCVACHQNLEPELRAAGHPELTFELDGQCVTMPRHWTETIRVRGAQAWLVGQAASLREATAQTNGMAAADVRHRVAALAWLLDIAPEHRPADELARRVASETWTETNVRSLLAKLASRHEAFGSGTASDPELAFRAERLVLGLERLLVALKLDKAPEISPRLDQLFKDVQSRPDFSPKTFTEHLRAFEEEMRKTAAR